jgi:hypothetical protein
MSSSGTEQRDEMKPVKARRQTRDYSRRLLLRSDSDSEQSKLTRSLATPRLLEGCDCSSEFRGGPSYHLRLASASSLTPAVTSRKARTAMQMLKVYRPTTCARGPRLLSRSSLQAGLRGHPADCSNRVPLAPA